MNILPKKRWHVRTKENIARVRKDEAEAAEKERQEILRIENADREARLSILKHKSRERLKSCGFVDIESQQTTTTSELQHINLFENLESAVKTTNKDHDKEVKDKKEEYEKKIGYLTYLGQDTNEALKKKNWYDVPPEESRFRRPSSIKDTYDKLVIKDEEGKPKTKDIDEKNGEIAWKTKQKLDPINSFRSYCHGDMFTKRNEHNKSEIFSKNTQFCDNTDNQRSRDKKKNKKKKHRDDKVEKEKMLQKLRDARLKREQQEKLKTQLFLSGHYKSTVTGEEQIKTSHKVKAKYNSQFNPELARQNYR